jgi:hypothetical protein
MSDTDYYTFAKQFFIRMTGTTAFSRQATRYVVSLRVCYVITVTILSVYLVYTTLKEELYGRQVCSERVWRRNGSSANKNLENIIEVPLLASHGKCGLFKEVEMNIRYLFR